MPQYKFRQRLKKLERKGIKVIEKSEKNTTNMCCDRFLHKSYKLLFKKLMPLSVVSSGRWKPERKTKER